MYIANSDIRVVRGHHGEVVHELWRLKSPINEMFAQHRVPANNIDKENIKTPHHEPFVKGMHWPPVDSLAKGQ